MIQTYFLKHWKVFSLGFGIGRVNDRVFDISIGIGVFTVGVQYVKVPTPNEILKELEEYEQTSVSKATTTTKE